MDKRIRVTADTGGIQNLRQEISQFYNELQRMSSQWRTMSEDDIQAVFERHSQLGDMQRQVMPNTPQFRREQTFPEFWQADRQLQQMQQDRLQFQEQNNSLRETPTVNATNNWLSRIYEELRKAFTRGNRGETVGGRETVSPTPQPGQQPVPTPTREPVDSKSLTERLNAAFKDLRAGNFGGAAGNLVGGTIAGAGMATLFSAFTGLASNIYNNQTRIATADSAMERELARLDRTRWIPFSARGRNVDITNANLQAYQANLPAQRMGAMMWGVTADEAAQKQFGGSVLHGEQASFGTRVARAAAQGLKTGMTAAAGGGAIGTVITPGLGTAIGGIAGGVGGFATGMIADMIAQSEEGKRAELHNDASYYLGKSVTEMTSDSYNWGRAGFFGYTGDAGRRSGSDVWQTQLARKIIDLDDSTITQGYATNRFGSDNIVYSDVIRDIYSNVNRRGVDPLVARAMTSEGLDVYNNAAQRQLALGKSDFDQSELIGIIQNYQSRGMSGQQLDRAVNAAMGNTMSKDPMTQALLVRAASRAGAGDVLDLKAQLEAPDKDTRKFMMEDMVKYFGNSSFTWDALTRMGFSANDVKKMRDSGKYVDEQGNLDLDAIFGERQQGKEFTEEEAGKYVTEHERSAAGTENFKTLAGVTQVNMYNKGDDKWFKPLSDVVAQEMKDILTSEAGINVNIVGVSDKATPKMQPKVIVNTGGKRV